MQKADTVPSAGTKAQSSTKDEDIFVSSHDTKLNVSGLPLSNDDESEKYAEDYVKRLKQRHLDFAALLSSGYFLSTIAIISFVELANSIINFPKSAHFLATS